MKIFSPSNEHGLMGMMTNNFNFSYV